MPEKKREKAADLRRITEVHYNQQAEQLEKELAADTAAMVHSYFSRAALPGEFSTAAEKRDEAKRDLAAGMEPACSPDFPLGFSRRVTSCKSCPFSCSDTGEWCRRYDRFNPPHQRESWGRPEWCEPGDIIVTIEGTEIEDAR